LEDNVIAGLVSGRKGSKGLPGKNLIPVLGRPLTWYALNALARSRSVERIYLSTDSPEIAAVGDGFGARRIKRPAELASDGALLEDVLVHGFGEIVRSLGQEPEMLVIALSNAPTVDPADIDLGVAMLRADPQADSVATVNLLNQYGPVRAKKIVDGRLVPAVDPAALGGEITCDRGCLGDVYFCDAALWIVRPRCLDLSWGQPPFRWMGQRVLPLVRSGGLDVDDAAGLVAAEAWLRAHGFSETSAPDGQ
jgi:hypothetical protein